MSTILIAYERELEQMVLEKLLCERGHTVVRSSNGVDALECARREPPQLVISDILLPKMDGFSLCKKWKQDERLQTVPFVFYTRRQQDPKYERFALELGVDRYVERSSDSSELMKGVDELLAQGVSATHPDTLRLQALSTGAFTTTARFAMTQPVAVAVPVAAAMAATTAALDANTSTTAILRTLGGSGGNEDRSLAREARILARATELDALNKQLQASEQRFRQLFDASPAPLWLLNADDRQCVAVNQAALTLYGFTREEFMALPRTAPPFAPGAAIAGTTATWHRNKTGSAIAIELHTRAVELGARRGEIVTAYDVTQRVFSQQATAHAAEAYQALLVAAADGMWLLDEQHNIIDVNEAYCRMSGYDRDELLKLSPTLLEPRLDDEPNTRLQQWRVSEQTIAQGDTADKSRYQATHVRKDGTRFPVEVSVGGVTGARPRVVVAIREITARQLELQAQEQRQNIRTKALQRALQLHRLALTWDEAALVRRALELIADATDSPLAYACATDSTQTTATLTAVLDRAKGPAMTLDDTTGKLATKGPSAQCMRIAQPVTVTDKQNAEVSDALPAHERSLIMPILDGDKCLGALAVANRETAYTMDDQLLLAPFADALSVILKNKRSHAQATLLAQRAESAMKGVVASLHGTPLDAEKK